MLLIRGIVAVSIQLRRTCFDMPINDSAKKNEIEKAIEVFVYGFSQAKSRTHPYEVSRVGALWRMRDAARTKVTEYRKEEWIAFDVPPQLAHETARAGTRGKYFICSISNNEAADEELKAAYKGRGYRLIATEPFFLHRLKRIPRCKADVRIELMRTAEQANLLAKATRKRPQLPNPKFRQYLAMKGDELVGWVRSIETPAGNWCSSMHVLPDWRRQGIGKALLEKMLRDDRKYGVTRNVLLASHTGALLYPLIGYERIGTLSIFAPKKIKPLRP